MKNDLYGAETGTTAQRKINKFKNILLAAASALTITAMVGVSAVHAGESHVAKEQNLGEVLQAFAQEKEINIVFKSDMVLGKTVLVPSGDNSFSEFFMQVLAGTGLGYDIDEDGNVYITDMLERGYEQISLNSTSDYEDVLEAADETLDAEDGRSEVAVMSLEEVIVTSTRRAVNLSEVPLSVSALGKQKLQQLGARDYQDYLLTVPGVSFTDSGGRSKTYTIRGISSLGLSGTTAFYMDETPINIDPRLFDVERVEILRGPQGTLFGASSMGGAIRTITVKPNLSEVEGTVEAGLATTKLGGLSPTISGAISIPLVEDKLAIRMVGYWERETGIIDNHTATPVPGAAPIEYTPGGLVEKDRNDQRVWGGRVALMWQATDDLNITANFYYQKDTYVGIDNEDVDIFGLGSFKQFRPLAETGQDESRIYNLTVIRDFSVGSLTVSSSYEDIDIIWLRDSSKTWRNAASAPGIFSPIAALVNGPTDVMSGANILNAEERWTHEARYVSNLNGPFQFVAGAYYSDYKIYQGQDLFVDGLGAFTASAAGEAGLNDAFFGPGPFGAIFQQGLVAAAVNDQLDFFESNQDLEELSFFGEVSYEFTDKVQLTLGLRQYNVTTEASSNDQGWIPTLIGCITNFEAIEDGAPCEPVSTPGDDLNSKESGVTYKANLAIKATDDVLIYGGVSTGYRPGGANAPSLPGETTATGEEIPSNYTSDNLTQYEIGWRATLVDGKVQFNGSIFYIDWTDLQTALTTIPTGSAYFGNVGTARSQGIELELVVRPNDRLTFDMAFSAIDAEFTEEVPGIIAKGDPIPNIPKISAHIGVNYEITDKLSAYADWTHVGERKEVADDEDPLLAYDLFNLRLAYDLEDWNVSLYVNNVFDARSILGDSLNEFAGIRRVHYNRPRTIGITTRYTF